MSSDTNDPWLRQLSTDTRTASRESRSTSALAVPGVTVLAHPNHRRVGEEATWPTLADAAGAHREAAELSRLHPQFAQPTGGPLRPLADPHLSRRPILLHPLPSGGLRLEAGSTRTRIEVDGVPVESECDLSADQLAHGAVLLLGGRIALLLHLQSQTTERPPDFGWVGESPAMLELRWEMARLVGLSLPILIRGESGTGKELAAQALQQHGPHPKGPFLSLNMGAIPASLAAAELFGATRGAFSGADKARTGYFQRADGGTLFLDEIGETPVEVQAMLLRTLEGGEIQPLGSQVPQRVRVHFLAATDADLETASQEGRFRAPLLHRLGGYEIRIPPLRQRRADIGRLFFHFLHHERQAMGETEELPVVRPDGRPWVAAELLATLARYDWPGNIRELRNVVRRLLIAQRGRQGLDAVGHLENLLEPATTHTAPRGDSTNPPVTAPIADPPTPTDPSTRSPRRNTYRDPSDVGEEELLATLRQHRFELRPSAEALGISRTSLYALIDHHPELRTASDLERSDIEACAQLYGGKFEPMAAALEVSKQALKRRMKALDMG